MGDIFLGLANVIEMATGINMMIIQTSESYKINTYITFIFLVVLIISNVILIQMFGITGAALGTLISYIFSNFLRFLFLKVKYNMQPFDHRILLVAGIGAIAFFIGWLVPDFNNFIVDIMVRSFVTGIIFLILTLKLKISEDINREAKKLMGRIRR